ncbi:Photosystem I assembly protein Ycf3 [uncultured archaeon]|nr:Photosystem I assembly protein Ycf3 [uncultured archaeon]
MRLTYAASILLLALMTSAQCQKAADDWYIEGDLLYNQGKYDGAIKAFDEAIRLYSNLSEAWTNKGAALFLMGKYDEAIRCFDEAIRLDPGIAMTWSNKGTALRDKGNYDEAIRAFDEAIRLDPNLAEAWNNKGTALYKQGRYDDAILAYDEAIKRDPDIAMPWSNKGTALRDKGNYDEAIKAYDEAIRLDPGLAAAWSNKGVALFLQERYDEAILCFDKAIELILYVQAMQSSTAINGSSISISENSTVKILGIDPTAFPRIKASVFVNRFCAQADQLRKENFRVREDGIEYAIDNIYFTGNARGQRLDLAVAFDDTGSMGEEISAMKLKVKDLTDTIRASGIDASYSLVSFKDSISIRTKWTNDSEAFEKYVDSLYAKGGDDMPEASLDAIEAVLSMGFRSDAQKVILVITDAHGHYKNDKSNFSNYTESGVEKDLKKSGAILISISPMFEKSSDYADQREVAGNIMGSWIDIDSANFSAILDKFKGIITGNYVIEYTTQNHMGFGNRMVLVFADAPECVVDNASNFYNKPGSAAVFRDSDLADAWLGKGLTLDKQGKDEEAVQDYDEAIRLDPSDAQTWNSKGLALAALGRSADADAAFARARELGYGV